MAKSRWWPLSLPLQYQLILNFKNKIEGYQAALGLTNPQVTALIALCNSFIGAYDFQVSTAATSEAVTEWRDQVFNGEPEGDPVSAAPIFAVMGATTATRGTVQQFFKQRDYILTLPGYTDAIGEDLGLIGSEITPPDPATLKPTLNAHAGQSNFLYSVVVGNRGEAQSWDLQFRPKGGDWASAGVFTGKSADITYNAPNDEPAVLELRVQLKKNNADYGLFSDSVTITVNP